ncbi:hypothetical protein SETIT_3G286700v2 [Setaria italica]|uniref:F-box domain-containing protein n=1 Tax=Setaria italica TaxID=4555 RepID=A0A368QJX6_SETIT|nr:hypothetical protein SETIT_3G286700v2 [Setaria italica]
MIAGGGGSVVSWKDYFAPISFLLLLLLLSHGPALRCLLFPLLLLHPPSPSSAAAEALAPVLPIATATSRLLATEPNKRHRTVTATPMDDTAAAAEANRSRAHAQRQQPWEQHPQQQPLLPGLPDHLAQLCLASLPPHLLHAVCQPWCRLLYSPSFLPFLSLYAVLDGGADATGAGVSFAAYDAIAGRWDELSSVAAAGRLVLVTSSTWSLSPALPRPVVFDPSTPSLQWRLGSRFRSRRVGGAPRGAREGACLWRARWARGTMPTTCGLGMLAGWLGGGADASGGEK